MEVNLRNGIAKQYKQLYLQMSVLAQAINVIIKVNDGTRIKEADNSSSQCNPENPSGQRHSYLRGGW